MVRTSMRQHMITKIQKAIDDDIVFLAANMAIEDDGIPNDQSDDELDDMVSTLNEIEEKARAILTTQLHRYLNPRV